MVSHQQPEPEDDPDGEGGERRARIVRRREWRETATVIVQLLSGMATVIGTVVAVISGCRPG